jgi:hypothetical protein
MQLLSGMAWNDFFKQISLEEEVADESTIWVNSTDEVQY